MKEKGFTPTPNKPLEALAKTKLSNYESRYILALIRKTFGWHKPKGDYISNSQFVEMTNIRKEHITRTKKLLLEKRIIIQKGRQIALNVNYKQWIKLPNQATVAQSGSIVTQQGKNVARSGKHKRNLTKEIKQKKNNSSFKKGEKELIEILVNWNNSQSSPMSNAKELMENIMRKHGYEKVSEALKAHGQNTNSGYYNFWKHLKEDCYCFDDRKTKRW